MRPRPARLTGALMGTAALYAVMQAGPIAAEPSPESAQRFATTAARAVSSLSPAALRVAAWLEKEGICAAPPA